MMQRQRLSWTLMLLLLPILILGLTACGGESESEAPAATTAEEQAAEGAAEAPAQTEETTAAEEQEAEAPAQTEETTAAEGPAEAIEVREATTVMAATQMIDLGDLPLPDGAELMGQPEPGSLRYQAPLEVVEVVDLYRSALTDQGWQEDVEAGHVGSASAALFFIKEDFKLSLSAGGMGEGNTMVSLTNHGNIDLRALPQMADAEELYNFPGSLGYVSPSDVADVADFTRRELAALGWHEYIRPHTNKFDDPEHQSFTLIRNGLELSVSVGVAPAQGGKTAVQYGVNVLPLDLPVPADAAGLEFEKVLLNLSLSYTTPADFETLFDYYSQEMTELGWVVIDDLGMMTPERATLFFGNENVPPHTLVLDLIPSDGQTSATLRYYEVDELTELTTPGTSSPADESTQMAGGEMPAIPIPDEAADVAYDADLAEITYTTLSDAETVTEFYRQSLSADGWQADEDSVMANDVFVNITFERDEESIDINSIDVSEPTRVTVNIRYAPSLTGEGNAEIKANVGDVIEMGDFSFTVTEVTSPEDMAYPPQEGNTFLQIVFTIENRHASDTFDSFYSIWLSIEDSDGWGYGYDELGFTEVGAPDDSYGSHNGQIAPDEQAQGRTIFQIPVDVGELFLVVEAPDLGDDKALVALPETEVSPMSGSAPDASAANIPDFLVPPDAQGLAYNPDSGSISYISPTDMETAIEFYRQSLSAEGWQEDEDFSSVSETFSFVLFNQGADTIQVDLFHLDDDETEVYVDISSALSLLGTIESGTGDDTASDSGPLSLVEEEGFPVPSDNTHWQPEDWQSELRQTAAFASPSDIDALVELYETELPGQGWEFIGYSLAGPEAQLHFEKDGQEFYIDLRAEGNLTAVELVIRNPAAAAEVGMVMPSDGQGRIYLGNFMEAEVVVTVDGQAFVLPPGDMMETLDEVENVELSPGVYTITSDIPDFGEASEEVELDAGEIWTIMVMPGGLLPIQAY